MTAPSAQRREPTGLALSLLCLAAAVLQLVLLAPAVDDGRSIDAGLFRADGLAVVFGVSWCLALALITYRLDSKQGLFSLLMMVGLLVAAYAREPYLFYTGWEIATLGLWLAARNTGGGQISAAMHLSGVPLLAAILLGLIGPFAPPAGGLTDAWHPALAIVLAAVVIMRAWLSGIISRGAEGLHAYRLYALAAPILLAKALTAAPWDPFGIWTLTLLGTTMMLGGAVSNLISGPHNPVHSPIWVWAGAIIAGFGLAAGSPLAAAGAVWLMLAGAFVVPLTAGTEKGKSSRSNSIDLALALPGVWLVAQGALDLRYGLLAAILLPCFALPLLHGHAFSLKENRPEVAGRPTMFMTLLAALALALAAYPQLPLEIAVRPAAQALAGGVGALFSLGTDWGIGLLVRPAQAALSAGLPATGIMVAVLLASIVLYWLKRLAAWGIQKTASKDR